MPIITRGAWRPCDAPDPGDGYSGHSGYGGAASDASEPLADGGATRTAVSPWVEVEQPEARARRGSSGYSYGRGEYVVAPAPSAPAASAL